MGALDPYLAKHIIDFYSQDLVNLFLFSYEQEYYVYGTVKYGFINDGRGDDAEFLAFNFVL